MSDREDLRRKARAEYVDQGLMLTTIAASLGKSEATVGRWKKAAKEAGDDWDKARAAHVIAGRGPEAVTTRAIERYFLQLDRIVTNIEANDTDPVQQVALLASLADSTAKMAAAAKRFAPAVSTLGVAQDVLGKLMAFVRERYPQHASAILEIIEPFGEYLTEVYAP